MKKRIVEIISEDKRYRKERYPAIILEDPRTGIFMNGLEHRPGKEETEDFLTQEEIKDYNYKFSKVRSEQFPLESIIRVDDVVSIPHAQKLDLTLKVGKNGKPLTGKFPGDYVYPRDYALYCFYSILPNVAKTKEGYNRSQHHFYLLDREYEATSRMEKRKRSFEAEKFLFDNISLEKQKLIAMLISFKTKEYEFGDISKLSATMIQDKLFEVAQKNPDFILACDPTKHPEVTEELFVIQAIDAKVLKKKGVSYYDGDRFAGDDMTGLIKYLKSDDNIVLSWKSKME